VVEREEKSCTAIPFAIAKPTVSKDLVLLADTGAWIAGPPIVLREPDHPNTHNLAAVLARLATIGGAGRNDPPTLLATRPPWDYPNRVDFPIYEVARQVA
jgi:hypothetical protein